MSQKKAKKPWVTPEVRKIELTPAMLKSLLAADGAREENPNRKVA